MPKGQGARGFNRQIGALREAKPVVIPEFVKLKPEAVPLWPILIASRAGGWTEFDLVLLARVGNLEIEIRRYETMLDQAGALMRTNKGEVKMNPAVEVLDRLQKLQLAIVRQLHMTQTGKDPRAALRDALKNQTFEAVFESDEDNLLAKPQ